MPNFRNGWQRISIPLVFCFLLFLLAIATSSLSNNIFEQDNVLPEKVGQLSFGEFLNSTDYLRSLKVEALQHERKYGACATPTYQGRIKTGRPRVPRSIPGVGDAPQWIEVVRIGGCKSKRKLSLLIALVDDAPKMYPLLPGNGLSLLDITITNDVLTTLLEFEQGHAVAAGCKKQDAIRIHHIRLTTYNKKNETIDWDEEWEIANCKTRKSLTVNFSANPTTGTHFTIHQPKPVKTIAKKKTKKKKSSN